MYILTYSCFMHLLQVATWDCATPAVNPTLNFPPPNISTLVTIMHHGLSTKAMALALAAKHHTPLPPATRQLVGFEPGHDAAAELAQVICPSDSGLDDGRQAAAVARVVNVDEVTRPGVAGEGREFGGDSGEGWEGVIG